jgi:hypothetical protein
MMEIAYDRAAVALVARVSGTTTNEELRTLGQALVTIDADAVRAKRTPVTLLIVIMSKDPPTADQRRLMADLWTPMRAPLHLFGLVSTSPVARGIMKVVQWLNPPGAKRRETVHSSFEDAVEWAEKERGESLYALRTLHAQLGRGGGVARAAR